MISSLITVDIEGREEHIIQDILNYSIQTRVPTHTVDKFSFKLLGDPFRSIFFEPR